MVDADNIMKENTGGECVVYCVKREARKMENDK